VAVGVWRLAGFFFSFSDAWQLVVNTGTTIATFLMVFQLQNTQNPDASYARAN
jgi:low affinity Fe/Cu permease